MKARIYTHSFKTRFGFFKLEATERGFYSLQFGKGLNGGKSARTTPHLKKLGRKLSSYLKGKKVNFDKVAIDWSGYSGFKRRVLENLRRIPRGKTGSYQFLAARAGRPKATRAVGQILHLNRLPIILPCHRILPKRGGLGGFAKGSEWKKRLLKLEGAPVDTRGEVKRGLV